MENAIEGNRPNFTRNSAIPALRLGPSVKPSNTNTFQEMVRTRLRERTPNMTTLAAFLEIDPSVIQRRLKDSGTALCLDFLDEVSSFFQMSVSEMCALPGAAWQEVKPLEAQLLATFRGMTELQRHSLLAVLDRTAHASTSRTARRGRAELTQEQQLLVDLFARSNEQARSGILKTLQGTARQGDAERTSRRTTE